MCTLSNKFCSIPSIDWLIDWLICSPIDWTIDWLIDLFTDWLIDWFNGRLIDWVPNSSAICYRTSASVTCHKWDNNTIIAGTFIGGVRYQIWPELLLKMIFSSGRKKILQVTLFDPRSGPGPVINRSQSHHQAVLGIHMSGPHVVLVGSDKKVQKLDLRANEFVDKKPVRNGWKLFSQSTVEPLNQSIKIERNNFYSSRLSFPFKTKRNYSRSRQFSERFFGKNIFLACRNHQWRVARVILTNITMVENENEKRIARGPFSIWKNSVTKFYSFFSFKMIREHFFFIFEHFYADRVDS